MNLEIERKFLIKHESWRSMINTKFSIKQGYLNTHPERTVRIRIKGAKGILTIKGKSEQITREEYEYEIPLADAERLMNLCEDHIIEKTRFIVVHRDVKWEIDEFMGLNQGLILAEVELASATQQIDLPSWIGEEVSEDIRYYNSQLTKKPFQDWPENE